ncbi:MAG TPA: YkgJ family cysteine cluster protein [Coleofasciculaceae cyanobacterium]
MDDQARSPLERLQRAQAIAQATRQRAIDRWRSAGLAGLLALQQDLWTEGDRAIAQALADQPVACDRGCAWCCYLTVPVMGLEARAIAHWLAVLPDFQQQIFRQRLTTTAARLQAVDPSDRLAQKIPCAFLEPDGACGIYPVRPATCRSHHARCADDCQAGWESGSWPARSVPTANFELEAAMAGLQAACEDCQVLIAVGELHGAVFATIAPPVDPSASP